jgi:hypothetical protein
VINSNQLHWRPAPPKSSPRKFFESNNEVQQVVFDFSNQHEIEGQLLARQISFLRLQRWLDHERPGNIPVLADLLRVFGNKRLKHGRVRTNIPQVASLRLPAVPMTYDPPKRAPKPTPNHIALVVWRHVQRRFGLKMKAEVEKGKIAVFHKCL